MYDYPCLLYTSGWFFTMALLTVARYSYRFLRRIKMHSLHYRGGNWENVMVIGAGAAAKILIREFQTSDKVSGRVCCVIDDDEKKIGRYLNGVDVYKRQIYS